MFSRLVSLTKEHIVNLPPFLSRFLHHDAVAGIALVLTTILGVILGWIYTPEVLSNLSEDMKSSTASSSTQKGEGVSPLEWWGLGAGLWADSGVLARQGGGPSRSGQ